MSYMDRVVDREALLRSVLFVDDHPIYRDGLRRTLESEISDLRVTTAGTIHAALELFGSGHNTDFCLSDYRLPDGDGLALLREVRKRNSSVALGLLSAEHSFALHDQARSVGAVLCLSKDRTPGELIAAIETIFQGGEAYDSVATKGSSRALSLRRREILSYASGGLLDKQICERMGVSESTIRSHWVEIFTQLDVGNRTEAVTKAIRMRLI